MTIPTDGLVAEYLFNGNALDTSGNENHGKVEGAIPTHNRFHEQNTALFFAGSGSHVVLEPTRVLNSETFSLSVWVKYDEGAKMNWWNNAIVSQDDNGRIADKSRRVFQISTMRNKVRIHFMMDTSDVETKHALERGRWYHLAVICDGLYFKLYLNSQLQDTQQYAFRPNAEEPIYIGKKNSDEPRFFFHGAIDDLRIYNVILSQQEIIALYTEQGYDEKLEAITPLPVAKRRESCKKKKVLEKPL
ncbi:hypothetical protein J2Z32_002752 [Paenibacillus turicensis]|uniref:LamG-like jellyroll fold domain-containing protein n=1 Tax=Paenibacillus turicensis TaxID=160487 RepID=A0ABS4FUS6_9BACL|nr:LamG domain-containing protein [Paenibacillus turicensis]MBP1906103.1 hypothetical protein [Paenibacillus turicensis]